MLGSRFGLFSSGFDFESLLMKAAHYVITALTISGLKDKVEMVRMKSTKNEIG